MRSAASLPNREAANASGDGDLSAVLKAEHRRELDLIDKKNLLVSKRRRCPHWSDERRFRFPFSACFVVYSIFYSVQKYPKMQELTNRGSPIDRVA